MFFRLVAILSVLGIVAKLTYLHFLRELLTSATAPAKPLPSAYLSWLVRRASGLIRASAWPPLLQSASRKYLDRYPLFWMRVAVGGLVLSFSYLAASGFVFAVFTSRGIFGLPLFIHFISGGIFAVCLAAILVFRAKEHIFLAEERASFWPSAGALSKLFSRLPLRSILFWLFIISGLFLTATALISMLPYFSYKTQLGLVQTHRYSALLSLLTAILLFDIVFLSSDK